MGKRVECEVKPAEAEFKGRVCPGVCVICGECGHEVIVAGEEEKSVKRGLATLREQCPMDEDNFYVEVDDD